MCVNYVTVKRHELDLFNTVAPPDAQWPAETWQDYAAPIIRRGVQGARETLIGTFGMVPQKSIPAGVKKFSTMNAKSETVGSKRSFSKPWRQGQLCLVPMTGFYEPNWELGEHVRWRIGMADQAVFAVAGLWRATVDIEGAPGFSFTQLTVNADDHPLMRRFHKPEQEKRSLVIVPASQYDDWLDCDNPEFARAFLTLYPSELMAAVPAPKK